MGKNRSKNENESGNKAGNKNVTGEGRPPSARTVFITGASAGIGEATAIQQAMQGDELILVARRLDRIDALAEKCRILGAKAVFTARLDVTDRSAVEKFFRDPKLAKPFSRLNVLVNNAGLAKGVAKADEASLDDWETMFETNVMGLLFVTRLALPLLKKNRGHIVNIGSVAGRWTYPGGAVYCATKAAVLAFSEGLRMDLQGSRVRVTNIEPGMVETDFSKTRLGDENLAKKIYENLAALKAQDIAECIAWSVSRPAHVNIQELVVFPTDQAGVSQVYREAPSLKSPTKRSRT